MAQIGPHEKATGMPGARTTNSPTKHNSVLGSRRMVVAALFSLVLPFLALEVFARTVLFDIASYTNSEKFDVTMRSLENAKKAVVVAFGSSETLYGFDPHAFQSESERLGCDLPAFNFGVEGFGLGHYMILLENLPFKEWAPKMKVALLGITLSEPQDPIPTTLETGFNCVSMAGLLQRSIYTSALGRDFGMDGLCMRKKEGLFRPVENILATASAFRYRSEIRALILDAPYYFDPDRKRRMARVTDRGFHVAWGMTADNYDLLIGRWLNDISKQAFWQRPLDEDAWATNLSGGGLFQRIKDRFLAMGVTPVFYALPTNPIMVTSLQREGVYQRNSERMRAWAKAQGIGFIDNGIPRDFDPMGDFEDHRHTSASGAARASKLLADALTEMDAGRTACVN